MSAVAAEADFSQFDKWHSRKPDRPNIISGKGDRASRSADSATANDILGTLESFSTVFVVKFIGTDVADRQYS
ncbi:MAG: hypothetical protein JGK17_11950 [Microcoleus sp. PH2017_10_PVI_O_A]|uniref:hypothetical protein n=1 Tax=unclassified Microcoleus TaxID=2642155 RepID=UPI001D9BA1EA|nr:MULTISPECIES: hypothetical protein [unclassified Microcoleus]TAE83192.1 MAG: hypothetical protein EAZ83_10220 [Oscillatoriales cyanobacterium]MCC3406281.1 hypothetical protein [Microcoleus sp. PH2017_10_PVI_O_A]MCC3460264.1 hypothetical protein [Microcoleus sp. PH2017_11_PCY_U_A]MCC3478798.1 hypothetical protein [Microcoleus sp. PH2017_12_PCY_D_A]MCC3559732.1 hypothetical protein [Microcoleus sp. PH2017_27_LUM_O_A]